MIPMGLRSNGTLATSHGTLNLMEMVLGGFQKLHPRFRQKRNKNFWEQTRSRLETFVCLHGDIILFYRIVNYRRMIERRFINTESVFTATMIIEEKIENKRIKKYSIRFKNISLLIRYSFLFWCRIIFRGLASDAISR